MIYCLDGALGTDRFRSDVARCIGEPEGTRTRAGLWTRDDSPYEGRAGRREGEAGRGPGVLGRRAVRAGRSLAYLLEESGRLRYASHNPVETAGRGRGRRASLANARPPLHSAADGLRVHGSHSARGADPGSQGRLRDCRSGGLVGLPAGLYTGSCRA
jgi:hypothetical protein